ncbi:caspase domain-containing protein [Streptomyces sp. NPDC059070]|uniref:caspase family protein n=1 Tax=Streptomyces sp. NPDC059070 TaxID=3346713 RepID=UPI0036803294
MDEGPPDGARPPYRALLIGNADFEDASALKRLRGPTSDLRELKAALTDPEVGLPWHVTELPDGLKREVDVAMSEFFEDAYPDERLLLYYSGHGQLDADGRLYLCARDTRVERMWATAVRHWDINDLMDRCAAGAIIVILDCCFSGRATDSKGADTAAPLAGRGRFVLSSCGRRELARDAAVEGEPSLFTGHLVAALRHGAVGLGGHVTAQQVHTYVDAQLRGCGQRPGFKVDGQTGNVPLARRPVPAPPAAEPPGKPAPEPPLDTSPVFAPLRGSHQRPPVECGFTGVVHVLLPHARGTLSVYRDALLAAESGGEVPGWWFAAEPLGYHRKRARLTGTVSTSGDVRFALPGDAGTVTWPAEQLSSFEKARATGTWPTTPQPTQTDATHTVLKAHDRHYRRLARMPWTLAGSLAVFALSVTLIVHVLTPPVPGQIPVYPFLLALFSGLSTVFSGNLVWVHLHIRECLKLPKLPIQRMLVNTRTEPAYTAVSDMGVPVTIPATERTYLWDDTYRLALPPGFFGGLPRRLSSRGAHTPLSVEVMGVPHPGQWVLARTPRGNLWPSGRLKESFHHEPAKPVPPLATFDGRPRRK